MSFDGTTYNPALDGERLGSAMDRVYALMRDGKARTLREVVQAVGCSESGASARLRDFRKPKFHKRYGRWSLDARRATGGLWEYRLVKMEDSQGQAKLF